MATAPTVDEIPNWELYISDLKVSKMTIRQSRPSLRFDIPILAQPPRYIPESGPPRSRIDLQLPHDTDAFIVDKVIFPLFTFRGDPRQRRAYYIIGWPDLPNVRPVVDCAKALEYVSPRTIEDWEYQDALRREAKQEQHAKEKEAAQAPGSGEAGAVLIPDGKKKRGRKPKNARLMEMRAPTPQLDSEQEELLAKRKHGPSLSTPQKCRVAQLQAEEEMMDGYGESMDEEDTDLDRVIQQQFDNEVLGEDEDVDMNEAGLDLLESSSSGSGTESSSRQRRGVSSSNTSSLVKPSFAPQKPKPTSNTPIPLPPYVTGGLSYRPSASSNLSSPRKLTKPSTTLSMRPISAHTKGKTAKTAPAPSRPVDTSSDQNTPQRAPPQTAAPPDSNNNGGFIPTNSFTPAGGYVPRPPKRPASDSPPKNVGSHTPTSSQVKKERKKKAPKISPPSPELQEVEPNPAAEPAADAGEDIEQPVEQEWVVKRLEGHQILDDQHWFKVRWEGDWPPDQNPTWEPQENIAPDLVKRYLKRKAEREAAKAKSAAAAAASAGRSKSKAPGSGGSSSGTKLPPGKSQNKQQTTLAQWARGYTSVSEAFEGKAELDGNGEVAGLSGGIGEDENDGQDDMEELFVVDKDRARRAERDAAKQRKSLGQQFAAQFGRRTEF